MQVDQLQVGGDGDIQEGVHVVGEEEEEAQELAAVVVGGEVEDVVQVAHNVEEGDGGLQLQADAADVGRLLES